MRVVDRRVEEVRPKPNKPYAYRRVYTSLEPGGVKEYFYGETSIFSRDEAFKRFAEKPYVVIQEKDHALLITPKWTGIRAGWLVFQNESFYVYRVDRFALWAGLVAEELRSEFDLEPKFKTLKLQGEYLTGSEEELEKAWRLYRSDLLRREDGLGIRVKAGRFVSLALKLLKDGVIPWAVREVKMDMKWQTDIRLRPYQQEALEFWLRHGNMTLLFPFGAGKTYMAVVAIALLSRPTLIVVPTLTLVRQWVDMLKAHLKGPRIGEYSGERKLDGEVVVATYQTALEKLSKRRWGLLVFDEAHHYPAPTYSRLAYIDADYRLSLTATPWREDGHSEYIYLLGGYPYGSDWNRLVEEGWIRKPPVYLHVSTGKFWVLKRLVEKSHGRLLVYCDSIRLGRELSRALNIPYVYGEYSTAKRLEMVEKHEKLIVSRVFDEGVDIPDLKTIVEYDFQWGSRRQEAQRCGRILHSVYTGTEYHIVMTPEELEKYGRRLQSLYARDFDVRVIEED